MAGNENDRILRLRNETSLYLDDLVALVVNSSLSFVSSCGTTNRPSLFEDSISRLLRVFIILLSGDMNGVMYLSTYPKCLDNVFRNTYPVSSSIGAR